MSPERHVTVTTDEPETLHEALGWVLEQFDSGGPLAGCEMPKITIEQIMVADSGAGDDFGGAALHWRPEWRVSAMGSFEQVGTKTRPVTT